MEIAMIQNQNEAFVQNMPYPLQLQSRIKEIALQARMREDLSSWTEQLFYKQLNALYQRRRLEHDRAKLVRILRTVRALA